MSGAEVCLELQRGQVRKNRNREKTYKKNTYRDRRISIDNKVLMAKVKIAYGTYEL